MNRTHLVALGVIAIAAIATALLWTSLRPLARVSVGPGPTLTAAAASPTIEPTPDEHISRSPVPTDRATDTVADFDTQLAHLVALAVRGMREVRAKHMEKAKATDAEARTAFETLVQTIGDAGERALFALLGRPEPDTETQPGAEPQRGTGADPTPRVERLMLLRIIDYTLQSRHALLPASAGQLSAFVAAMLDAIQQSASIAADFAPLLIDKPYLDQTHEDDVLRLAELSPVTTHLQACAARLITTLWTNLARTGARRSGQLESLAMMLKDDTNPAKRSAAMQHLLAADDPRLVDFVLAEAEQARDPRLARELAMGAVEGATSARALEVLQRMRRVEDTPLTSATLTLALKDPAGLREKYETLVGEGRDARLRADLITGLGFNPSPENTALTQLAFDSDPDPEVRARALLALSTSAARGEEAIGRALDDATFLGKRGERMRDVIAAIQNLAGSGQLNAVARLGKRVLARPGLAETDRKDLERILREALPPELR